MPNPTPTQATAAARAARAAQLAAAVTRARQWLDEPDYFIVGSQSITRRQMFKIARSLPALMSELAKEYAAATGLHPRTARRHLELALKQEK